MGQKVNPHGLRVGINKDWDSRWFANKKDFSVFLKEDNEIRDFLKNKLAQASVPRIEIERYGDNIKLDIYTGKPGMVIGKGGEGIEDLKKDIKNLIGRAPFINIIEVKDPDSNAQLVAENIAASLERRIAFRRAMKQAMQRTIRSRNVEGIKVKSSGRLGGAEMARTEGYSEGRVPLHTLRADIDYGFAEADTTYGKIGVKVWIYKGEILLKRASGNRNLEELAPKDDKRKKKRNDYNDRDGRNSKRPNDSDKRPQRRDSNSRGPKVNS